MIPTVHIHCYHYTLFITQCIVSFIIIHKLLKLSNALTTFELFLNAMCGFEIILSSVQIKCPHMNILYLLLELGPNGFNR